MLPRGVHTLSAPLAVFFFVPRPRTTSATLPTDAMKKACKLIVAGALCMGLRTAFVPAPARGVAPAAAAGGLAVLGGASAAHADAIDNAAAKLSAASYPFLKEINWESDVFATLPTASPLEVLDAVDKMIVMGAAMDGEALKKGALAHSAAIQNIDEKGIPTLADYTAMNAAIGHMVASAGEAKTMDVYKAFQKFGLGKDVGPYMMSMVNARDAKIAYKAFIEFKDVVREAIYHPVA